MATRRRRGGEDEAVAGTSSAPPRLRALDAADVMTTRAGGIARGAWCLEGVLAASKEECEVAAVGGGSGMPRWGRPTSVEDKARSMTKSNDGEEEDKRLVAQRGEETGGIISSPSIGRRPTTTAL
jgi:hypothetical protein